MLFENRVGIPRPALIKPGPALIGTGEGAEGYVAAGMGSAGDPPHEDHRTHFFRKGKSPFGHLFGFLKGGWLKQGKISQFGKRSGILFIAAGVGRGIVAGNQKKACSDADEVQAQQIIRSNVQSVLLHSANRPQPGKRRGGCNLQGDLFVDRPFHVKSQGLGHGGQILDDVGGRCPGISGAYLNPGFQGASGNGFIAHEQNFFPGCIQSDDGHDQLPLVGNDGRMEYWNIGKMQRRQNPSFHYSNIPIFLSFHDSIIPIFQHSSVPYSNIPFL